ncbi:hypothetical protein [Methanimicrococcus hongohii]|nr:hypothetical protein [Methanimicrococcus sp. Hf6]
MATKKYFLIPSNKKYNIFWVRLLFTIPIGIAVTFLLTVSMVVIFGLFLRYILPFDDYFLLLVATSSVFTIFAFQKYFVRKDVPPEYDPNFADYESYVFMPLQKIPQRKYNKFAFPSEKEIQTNLTLGIQKENLKLNYKTIVNKNFVFTESGEIIVTEKIFQEFEKNGFNNEFKLRPIQAVKGLTQKPYEMNETYYQLIPLHTMPPLNSKTEIKKVKANLSLRQYVVDDKFYYNQDVMKNISNFNVMTEILGAYDGAPYYPQKLWVVTNDAMKFLINDLEQHKRDFIPITLVDVK